MNSLWKHPLPLYLFIEETNLFHLCIDNIRKLNPGDKLEILCLDRNVWDLTMHNEENKVMSATKFFKKSYQGTYTHIEGLKGTFLFKDIDDQPQDFEFHIEWEKNRWYPLVDGKLQSDEQFTFPEEFENKSWDTFSDNTRIGWRGPMILKKWFKYLPKVYNMNLHNFHDEVNLIINTE
jgi:hypothetical protein